MPVPLTVFTQAASITGTRCDYSYDSSNLRIYEDLLYRPGNAAKTPSIMLLTCICSTRHPMLITPATVTARESGDSESEPHSEASESFQQLVLSALDSYSLSESSHLRDGVSLCFSFLFLPYYRAHASVFQCETRAPRLRVCLSQCHVSTCSRDC